MAAGQARYDELMELMASNDLYNDKEAFDKAMEEYNRLKPKLERLEEEWLELSSQIEEQQSAASGPARR